MGKERAQNKPEFDPEIMADMEIIGIQCEFSGDQETKFQNEVGIIQKLYGLSEITAYHLVVLKNRSGDEKLSSDEKRNATVEYYELLSRETGLGFDPYEASLVQEKLNASQRDENNEAIVDNLAKLYSVVFSKPVGNFLEVSRLRVNSVNEVWSALNLGIFSSPSFFLGASAEQVRSQVGSLIDYEELRESFVKTWIAYKKSLEE